MSQIEKELANLIDEVGLAAFSDALANVVRDIADRAVASAPTYQQQGDVGRDAKLLKIGVSKFWAEAQSFKTVVSESEDDWYRKPLIGLHSASRIPFAQAKRAAHSCSNNALADAFDNGYLLAFKTEYAVYAKTEKHLGDHPFDVQYGPAEKE